MRKTHWLALILCAGLAGCANSGGGGRSAVPMSAFHSTVYGSYNDPGDRFQLAQDVTIDGQKVPKGTYVSGLSTLPKGSHFPKDLNQLKWRIPLEYEHLRGRDNCVFGKRFGQNTYVRFDMSQERPKEIPTPYTNVTRVRYERRTTGYYDQDRWVAVEESAKRMTLLDAKGNPALVIENCVTANPDYVVMLLRQEGAFVVRTAAGDRIYDRNLQPISPQLPSMWNMPIMRVLYQTMAPDMLHDVFGVRTDPKHPRYWLLQENGKISPKPDDLIGLEPLVSKYMIWDINCGWLVWWKTPEGDRCAWVDIDDPWKNVPALMESRQRAHFVEWHSRWNDARFSFEHIGRRAGQTRFEIHRSKAKLTEETFASIADAESWLKERHATEAEADNKAAIARMEAQKRYEAFQRAEKIRMENERIAWENRRQQAAIEKAQVAFDQAIARNDSNAARRELIQIPFDPVRWTQYVSKYGLDPAYNNSSYHIGYARAANGGTDNTVLQAALKRANPVSQAPAPTYRREMSDWEYFWNGPSSGSFSGGGFDASSSHDRFMQSQRETNQRNFDAWMRGAQNWGGPR